MRATDYEKNSNDLRMGLFTSFVGGAFSFESVKNLDSYNHHKTYDIPDGYIGLGISGTLTFLGLALTTVGTLNYIKLKRKLNLEKKLK